jgi:hypothetical protein
MPYIGSLKESVDGIQVLYYAPNTYIIGNNLPDRESTGGSNNGTFVWGGNPSTVGVTVSYLEFDATINTGSDITTPDSVDVLAEPDNMSHEDADMGMPFHIFYFMVSWLSSATDIDAVMIWWWLSAALSIAVLVLARRFLNSIWIAGFLSTAVSAAFVAMGTQLNTAGALEFWVPVVIILATACVGAWLKTSEV